MFSMISHWSKSHPVISYWIESHPMSSCFSWFPIEVNHIPWIQVFLWFPIELNHIPWVHVFLWFPIKLNYIPWIQVFPWIPIEIHHILFTIELNHILRMHYHVPRCHPLPTCLYAQGNSQGTFYLCQASVKKILKDENVITKIPAIIADDFLQETGHMLDHMIVPMSPWMAYGSHNFCHDSPELNHLVVCHLLFLAIILFIDMNLWGGSAATW
jgi:hypothetical protein